MFYILPKDDCKMMCVETCQFVNSDLNFKIDIEINKKLLNIQKTEFE